MGGGGFPGAIERLPQRIVPPRGRLHLFVPFERLPADVDFETLRLGIYHGGGRVQLTVTPRRDVPYRLPVLPLGGEVFVEAAGDLNAPHRRISLTDPRQPVFGRTRNSERWALDLTVIDDAGRYRGGPRTAPASWYAWDRPVRAPVDARVVKVRGDVPDNTLVADGGVERAVTEAIAPFDAHLGNHVVLELEPEVFLVLAHLRAGSVEVEVGDLLWPGALVGRVGLSGASTYPHLHMQLQRGPEVLDSDPLPVAFACVVDRGGGVRRPAWLATGDVVGPCRIGREQ
jgi:murein DD-endopeptidase MepM/ murein hydrolase activator NlpD